MNPRSRRIVALAVPAVGTLIADPLMGLFDTAVIGRLGPAPLGAMGLAIAVLSSVSWIFNFLVFGTTSTVARAMGARDLEAAGRRVSHALQVGTVIGLVVGGVLFVTAPLLLRGLGAVETLIEPGTTYLRIRAVGVPLMLIAFVGHGAFRGVSDTRTPLSIAVLANVVNAGLTLLFVFPLGMGLAGAAWATVVAEAIIVGLFALRLARTGLPLTGHGRPSRTQLSALVVVSRDLFLRTGGLLAGILAITAAAARIDEVSAAAHQVVFQCFLLISFLMDGLAIAGQAMVGTALGAEDTEEAQAVGRTLLAWGIIGGVGVGAVLLVGSGIIPRLLTDDPVVLSAVAGVWWLAAVGQIVNGPVFALDGVLMGAEDFAYLRTWTMTAAATAGISGQVAVSLGGGLFSLWLAVQAMMVIRLLSLVHRVRGESWLRTGGGLVIER